MIASYTADNGERWYTTPEGEFPSVTTILDATADHEWLRHWRRKVGAAEANRIRDEAKARGTALHEAIELHLLAGREPTSPALAPWWSSVQHVLSKIDRRRDVLALEEPVYHRGGFAGTFDLGAMYDGKPTIIDWKTSRAPKRPDRVIDYGLQLAAYSFAAEQLLGMRFEQALIVVALADRPAQVFALDRNALHLAWYGFLRRLKTYQTGKNRRLVAV